MKMLVIAPHPDDEVLGIGGTIARRRKEGWNVCACIVTRPGPDLYDQRKVEKGRAEASDAKDVLGTDELCFMNLEPTIGSVRPQNYYVKNMEKIIESYGPDEIYIPHWGDMHLDHKAICESVMVATRPKPHKKRIKILAYETLSETGNGIVNASNVFMPNVYIDISEYIHIKLEAVRKYASQVGDFPDARSVRAVEALAMYRGASIGVNAAEAFQLIREII